MPFWARRGLYLAARLSVLYHVGGPVMRGPIYLDQTHVRGHVTGIERVALDQFTPAMLGTEVRPLRSRGLPGMILAQQVGIPVRAAIEARAQFVMAGFPPGRFWHRSRKRSLLCVYDTFLLDPAAGPVVEAGSTWRRAFRARDALGPALPRDLAQDGGGPAPALRRPTPWSPCCGRPCATCSGWRISPAALPTGRGSRSGSSRSAPSSRARIIGSSSPSPRR